jgi:DHA1 family multidrug resistance protein-like MFS transporter
MAAARTLPELFLSRVLLGFMGASSTLAFTLAGRTADPGEVRRRIAAIQSGMTVGQMLGPLAGAVVAAWVGFRPSFVIGGLILFVCAGVVHWAVDAPLDPREHEGSTRPPARIADLAVACTIILAGSSQVFYLMAVLPDLLPRLGVAATRVVQTGGLVVFISAAGAAAGALLTPHVARMLEESRLVAVLLAASSACLALQWVVPGILGFMVFRFLQVLCVAPVFPLVVARVAQHAGGAAIGVVNSARIGAAFLGPVLATAILAWTSPPALFAVLTLLGLAAIPLVLWRWPAPAALGAWACRSVRAATGGPGPWCTRPGEARGPLIPRPCGPSPASAGRSRSPAGRRWWCR